MNLKRTGNRIRRGIKLRMVDILCAPCDNRSRESRYCLIQKYRSCLDSCDVRHTDFVAFFGRGGRHGFVVSFLVLLACVEKGGLGGYGKE